MPLSVPPARSLLFVPGNRTAWLTKAVESEADGVIIDLEDAVPAEHLGSARRDVHAFIDRAEAGSKPVIVRVGMPGTPSLEADISAVVGPGLTGVMLPMIRTVEEVLRAEDLLARAEEAAGMEVGTTVLVPILETPEALRLSYELATATPRAAYMGAGISRSGDIARTLGYQWTPEGFETLAFRSMALVNLRAAHVPNLISGVWGDVKALDGLQAFAEQSRQLGYDGMMIIHPSHAPVVNAVFTPTEAEVAAWHRVVAGLEAAEAEGRGTTTVDGLLVDAAQVVTARVALERARLFRVAGADL